MSGLDNGVKRDRLILGILFIAASVAFIVAIHMTGALAEVVKIYFPYADSLFNGVIPDMEYPPFALVFIALPRLFAATEMGYLIVFVAEVAVFFIIGLIVTGKLAKRYNFSQHMAMLIYTILMLLMFEFVVDRFDIFPAILTLLSFYCLVTKRYVWAFALLSIATMTKLYPAVLFPIYLIPLIYNRDWMNALKGAGVFILVAALTILPFILAGSLESATYFLTYHMDRPIQIESTASSIIFLFQALGLTNVDIVFSYGSDNIVGPWPDAVAPFLTPLMIAAVVAVYAMYAYMLVSLRRDGKDNENNRMILLGSAALLSIMAFMIFGKVFSSQYPIWIIPPIVFMMMMPISPTSKRYILAMTVAAIILAQLNFAVNIGISGGGANITDAGMMIVLARNVLLFVLFAYIIRISMDVWKKPRRAAYFEE